MPAGKKWTNEDIEALESYWGNISIPAIARKLGRSVEAVKEKAFRLGLRRHLHSGTMITFNQFCIAIGRGPMHKEILERFRKLGLPIHYKASIKTRFAMVDIDEFWTWAEKHKSVIDFSRIEPLTFGAEPDWVKEARAADFRKRDGIIKTPWTPTEDRRLKQMLEAYRYTYDDISRELRRTEGAVKRRIFDLGLPQRPMRRPIRPWTDEEVKQLCDMLAAGYGFEAIAQKLGRSALACRGKYEHVLNPGYFDRDKRNNREALRDCFQRFRCEHWHGTTGCELKHTDCDACLEFRRRDPDEDDDSGWVSITGAI